MEASNEPERYEVTLYYRDDYSVMVPIGTREAALHLMNRLMGDRKLAIVIDNEQSLFLLPDNLVYARVTPPLE